MTITQISVWRAFLANDDLESHWHWFQSDRQGTGRIEIEEENLSETMIPGANLMAARLIRCKLQRSNFIGGNLTAIELKECILDGSLLLSTNLQYSGQF